MTVTVFDHWFKKLKLGTAPLDKESAIQELQRRWEEAGEKQILQPELISRVL